MNESKENEILEHLTNNNYGPDRTLDIKWPWVYRVEIKPKQRIRYRFSFAAWFENAVIVYSMPYLTLLAERGNYSRSTEDFDFVNEESTTVEHIVTGWHKPSPPRASKPWLHSPKHRFQGTPNVDIIGFADDQGREKQHPKPTDLYRNALVSIEYY